MSISKKYQKDYKNVSFRNPRVIKENQQKSQKYRKMIYIVAFILILLFFYWLFFSPYFKITNLEIKGINKISQEKFEQIINNYRQSRQVGIFSHNNMIFFSEQGLKQKVGESYLLENIQIIKDYPNTVIITVIEKKAKIVWLTQNQCFHLDQDGQVIEYCEEKTKDLIRIKDATNNSVKISDQVIDRQYIDFLIKSKARLSEQLHPLTFILNEDNNNTVKVELAESYYVLLNKNLDLDDQVNRLYVLLADPEIQANLNTYKYFDLRFGEKIYYK